MIAPRKPYDLLVELANFDPETARPGDVLNWRQDLDRLVEAGTVREDEILPIHADLQRVVRQYAAGEAVTAVAIDALQVAAVGGATPKFLAIGGTHTVAILTTVMLLVRAEREIRICPECERLFVRVRRQQYCSRPCVNRATMRAYRAARRKKAKKRSTPRVKARA